MILRKQTGYYDGIPTSYRLNTAKICNYLAHPDSFQSFILLVQDTVDVIGVEQGVSGNLAQQVPGKVADVVLAEVPLPQHSARNHRLGVFMAALAEVTTEVFTVTQSLDII